MKKEETLVNSLQDDIVVMRAIIEKQAEGLELYKELIESSDRRLDIQTRLIGVKDEMIAVLEKHNASLEKDNLRLNIAIGIFLSIALVWCTVKIIML